MVIFDPDRKAKSAIDVCGVIEISHGVNDVIEPARHRVTHDFGPENDVSWPFDPLWVRGLNALGCQFERPIAAAAKRFIEP
jgi:hypothetical protein